MKKILLKKAIIIHPDFKENTTMDILIDEKGVIEKIAKGIKSPNARVISSSKLHVSAGWLDIGTQICEPGYEHKEDLRSITACALAGGYTAIAAFPNTKPAIYTRALVENIRRFSFHNAIDIYPIGAINDEQGNLTEMMDMHDAGALAFSNGKDSIQSSGDLVRALQYVSTFDGVIIDYPHDEDLASEAEVNESFNTNILGMKGIPELAETLQAGRNQTLNQYAKSKLLLHTITSVASVKSKQEGVYASVSSLHLTRDDSMLSAFDTNLKVWPPLRGQKAVKKLRKAVENGKIDIIVSNHSPQGTEEKNKEFGYAEFGAINLQTCFSDICTNTKIPLEVLIDKICYKPREIFSLEIPPIKVGEKANLTIFDPTAEFVLNDKTNKSKSQNTPLYNQPLKGKVIATIHKSILTVND